jgi:hypothetical protein
MGDDDDSWFGRSPAVAGEGRSGAEREQIEEEIEGGDAEIAGEP